MIEVFRLESVECETTISRKSWDGRVTESISPRSRRKARPCVYGCGANGVTES
jgi:hypothetical protein